METRERIGKTLRRIRGYKNKTQEYVAKKSSIDIRTYRRLESDSGNSLLSTFAKCLKALDVSLKDFFNKWYFKEGE